MNKFSDLDRKLENTGESKTYFSIQFLRFFAAFAVVLHHAAAEFMKINVFAAGVDIFFVISGFVITFSTPPYETAYRFAAKRIIRVMPMYWLATFLYVSMKYYFWSDLPSFGYLAQSLALIPNLGVHWYPLYFLGWTLVYEVAFYSLFGILLKCAPQNVHILCISVLAGLASVSIPAGNGNMLSTDILLEFVFGILIARSLQYLKRVDPKIGIVLCALALMLFAWNYGGQPAPTRPMSWGIPATLLVASLISLEGHTPFFRWNWVRRLGASSYAIYLTHLTVLSAIEEALKRHGFAIKAYPLISTPVFLISSILVGLAVNAIVEVPLLAVLRMIFLGQPHRLPYLKRFQGAPEHPQEDDLADRLDRA